MSRKRKRNKKQQKPRIILDSQKDLVHLYPFDIKIGDTFLGSKVLRRNELWDWKTLEDIKF